MHITVSGLPGVGKTSLVKDLSNILDARIISASLVQRQFAESLGMNIEEFQYFLSMNPDKAGEYDIHTDQYISKISEFHKDENIIFDSRLAFYFTKTKSIDVSLTCNPKEAAYRVFHARKDTEIQYSSIAVTEKLLRGRYKNEWRRYKQLYNIDLADPNNYHLMIDTTDLTQKEVVKSVLDYINKNHGTDYRPLTVEDIYGDVELVLRNGSILEVENGRVPAIKLSKDYSYDLKSTTYRDYDIVNIIRNNQPLLFNNLNN